LTVSVEAVGGYLNAFTTEDHTCFYAKAGASHFERICDVLLEMYTDSQFPAAEVEREREIIREEILSIRDAPAQWVEDLLSETLWPRHPLGRPLAGTAESLKRLTVADLRSFRDRFYTGRNTVFTVAGPMSHGDVLRLMSERLSRIPPGVEARAMPVPRKSRRRVRVERDETEQAHLAMGFHAVGRTHPRRMALRLLSVILGENMSSRLFQILRERRGDCYSVQSSTVLMEGAGMLSIYADLDPDKLPGALRALSRELRRLCEKRVPKGELRRAQDFAIGQTQVALDSATQQISWMAESLMAHGRVVCPEEVEQQILQVTSAEVQSMAQFCLRAEKLGLALITPGCSPQDVLGWLDS
jgi:predicted Zn-dependent peptidase